MVSPFAQGYLCVKPMSRSGILGSCETLAKGCAMTCPPDASEKKVNNQLHLQIEESWLIVDL